MSLYEDLRLVKIVLLCIKKAGGTIHYTPLYKNTLNQCGTFPTFKRILKYLMENGHIEKMNRGKYKLTEKGENFLKVL